MATSPGKWEVVGKGGKPRKSDHGNKKNKTKVNEADMPKLDIKEPIPECKTQFGAFAEEQTPFVPPKEQPKNNSDNEDDEDEELPAEVVKRPEKRRKHHKEPQQSLQEVVTEAMKKNSGDKEIRKADKEKDSDSNERIDLGNVFGYPGGTQARVVYMASDDVLMIKKIMKNVFTGRGINLDKCCDLVTVKSFVSEMKQKYENQLVTLKELTEFLQKPLETMSVEKDPVLGKQTPDFPLCCLDEEVQDVIFDELRECDENEIDKLYVHCLDELLIEINKGRATYGIRTMIQCLVKCFPLVAVKNTEEYLDRVAKRKNNSREALSLLWTFGQASDNEELVERFTVWTSFFLPFLEYKQLSKYVVDYLEVTLSLETPKEVPDSLLDGKEFRGIMEITLATHQQQFPFRRQLQLLYPEIKELVFLSYPNTSLTDIFYQLFDSLNADNGKDYTREALNCLVECLEKDPACHFKWRNNYLARLKESSLLLKALVEQWESVCRSVPKKYLYQTLREFRVANTELKAREKHKAGLSECETSCGTLLEMLGTGHPGGGIRVEQKSSRLRGIFKFLFWILLAVVCVDLYKHSGYEGSRTSRIFKRYGIEKVLNTSYQHTKVFVQRLDSWTEKRSPYYYKKVQDVVEPASRYTMTKLTEFLIYLAEITEPVRDYLDKNIPPLLEKVEKVFVCYFNCISEFLIKLWDTCSPVLKHYAQVVWDALATYVPPAWMRAREIAWSIRQWVYHLSPEFFDAIADGFRHLVEEVVTGTPHLLALVQEYLLTAWNLVVSGVASVVLWFQTNFGLVAASKNTAS